MNEIIIRPFIGVGDAILGSSEARILEVLGEPTSIEDEYYGQEEIAENLSKIYKYDDLEIDLTFSAADEFKLGTITVYSTAASIYGIKLIGLHENDFLKKALELGHGKPVLDDDWTEYRDYVIDSLELSFWVLEDIVDNVSIFPQYDETGNIPLWP